MTRFGSFPCEVLVGARGWEHEAWTGRFYPEDLPEDWRLTYYANAFRSVLVPAERLASMPRDDLRRWPDEVPEDFVFYLEISRYLMAGMDSSRFMSLVDALGEGIGGILFQLSAQPRPTPDQLEPWLAALSGRFQLVASLSGEQASEDLGNMLRRFGVAAGWRHGDQPWTEQRGCMGFLDGPVGNLRQLREQMETFMGWVRDCDRALLCFDGNAGLCETMEQARIISELARRRST